MSAAANHESKPKPHPITIQRPNPSIKVDDVNVTVSTNAPKLHKPVYDEEARKLRRNLRLYFYSPLKWKGNTCSFHFVYCFIFLLQIIKVALLTAQMFDFGHDRANFSSVVNRGHITLRHLLLKDWDATWETLPYPPAHGDFAVYTISDWEKGINFAVEKYYNAEEDAIGYYKRLPADTMTAHIKYFDFQGFSDSNVTDNIAIYDTTFTLAKGWSAGNKTYNITKEFVDRNILQPFKRMLMVSLQFKMHSVRSHVVDRLATCLLIEGWINFSDLDNNGQVNVDLITKTSRIRCAKMNLTITDWSLEGTSKAIGGALLGFCLISLLSTLATVAFAVFVFWQTKKFMKKYYRDYYGVLDLDEKDLRLSEYFRFLKLWDMVSIISDILTIYATVWIVFNREESDWLLETLDSYTVCLGVACVMAWLSLLRFFKFHSKFHLLFSTLYRAFWDVLAYLICVTALFVGFWVCGFVVMGPYHVKFQTPSSAAETLFAIVTGDEIYATIAILDTKKTTGGWVFWFSKFYIGFFVAVFTIVVLNLLIALFMNAYDAVRELYDAKPEERDLVPVEKALRQYLIQQSHKSSLRSSVNELMRGDDKNRSREEVELRRALGTLVRVSKKEEGVVFMKPRTLKAFIEDGESGGKVVSCGDFCKCSFATFTEQD